MGLFKKGAKSAVSGGRGAVMQEALSNISELTQNSSISGYESTTDSSILQSAFAFFGVEAPHFPTHEVFERIAAFVNMCGGLVIIFGVVVAVINFLLFVSNISFGSKPSPNYGSAPLL